MFMACGVAAYSAGIFHLMTHAFFKGLLFLGAGSVIHAVGGEQDMRKMGGLKQYIPWTFMTMSAATFAISGLPPFAGFFSKDEILARAYEANPAYWFVGVTTAFITSFYMFRLWYMTFFGDYRGREAAEPGHASAHARGPHHGDPHESPMVMLAPLMIPIELISHLARVLSLTIRLYANMFAGDMVTLVFFSLVPIGLPVIFIGMHIGVSFLQTYIFVLLTTVYLAGAVAEEH